MQSEEVFWDMISSIDFPNVSKALAERTHGNFVDSGFNSGAEMNSDNILFYEDNRPSMTNVKIERNNDHELPENFAPLDHQLSYGHSSQSIERVGRRRHRAKGLKEVKVNVGIDEDLKMILEMDPSLIDEDMEKAASEHVNSDLSMRMPQKM